MRVPYSIVVVDRNGHVVASSSDMTTVRISASMVASNPDTDSDDPAFEPITAGRATACRAIAMGEV